MFKETTEYEDIKRECINNGSYQKPMQFSCFTEKELVMIQELEGGYKQELSVMTDDDIIAGDTPENILNLECISFVHHRIYNENDEVICEKYWAHPVLDSHLN
jgi:hypothetical protein